MFDSHCHLDADEYDADRSEVIARAKACGVTGIMVPGYLPEEWPGLKALCALDPVLCCAVGLHPWYVHQVEEPVRVLDSLGAMARQVGALAIGECGLDAPMARRGGATLQLQEQVLLVQLELVRELGLPVILHCLGAHERMLTLLKKVGPLAGVMHSFSGSRELVPQYLKLGLSFSFAGIMTRENARRPREAMLAVPLERLLVESDGPDQAAQDVAPGRSEPAHVALVLAAMAKHRGVSVEALARATSDNACQLFGRPRAHAAGE